MEDEIKPVEEWAFPANGVRRLIIHLLLQTVRDARCVQAVDVEKFTLGKRRQHPEVYMEDRGVELLAWAYTPFFNRCMEHLGIAPDFGRTRLMEFCYLDQEEATAQPAATGAADQ